MKRQDTTKQLKCRKCYKNPQEWNGYRKKKVNGVFVRVKDENGNDIKIYRAICTKCKMKQIDARHNGSYAKVLRTKVNKDYLDKYGLTKAQYDKEQSLKHNLPMLRFMYQGDTEKELTCMWSNDPLENIVLKNYKTGVEIVKVCIMDLHHMLVKDRCSVKKSGQEPSMIVGKGSLYNKQTKTIAELLRCIPITSTSHTQIHHINKNLDLDNYPDNIRPWAIRSKENFESFKEKYNYPLLDYDRLIKGLYHD